MKLLAIGNSFSDDCLAHVAEILVSLGVQDVLIANLYIGGCSLQLHCKNAKEDAPAYEYRINTGNGWTTQYEHKMSDAIQSQEWDIIMTQQWSRWSGNAPTYDVLDELLSYVRSLAKGSPKYAWQMTWAYPKGCTLEAFGDYQNDQMLMYESILKAVQEKIAPREDIFAIIPTGSAVQNAREIVGEGIIRDELHLTYGLGRYIAGLCAVGALTGLDIEKATFAPEDVDEEAKQMAIKVAKAALRSPYEITKI